MAGAEEEIKAQASVLPGKVNEFIKSYQVQEAVVAIIDLVRTLNKYMETHAPWKLAKTDMKAAERVLYTAAEGLRIVAVMLSPVMPQKTAVVLDVLGAKDSKPVWGQLKPGTVLGTHPPLFPRIETQEKN